MKHLRNFGSGGAGNLVFYSFNENNCTRKESGKRPKKSWSERHALSRQLFRTLA